MKVTVAWASPASRGSVEVDLPECASLDDAVRQSGALVRAGVDAGVARFAIFGQAASPATPLRSGDRVEVTRPLLVDPKSARRARAELQPASPSARPPRRRKRN
jgi:putative ubiquitin-RnfH superfamily antitoxin RatB of RatAB toxin-antitoxin module